MSRTRSRPIHDHDDHEYRHDDHHPALTPLVIDLIPDQTRTELEAVIDEPLAIEREAAWETERRLARSSAPKDDDREEMSA